MLSLDQLKENEVKAFDLSRDEFIFVGTRFEYSAPKPWEDESGCCWTLPDEAASDEDVNVLKVLQEKRLVFHMDHLRWPVMVDKDCWVLTEHGLHVMNWFHSFPENYGL